MKEKIIKKGITKRLLSVVLALAMVITFMPMNTLTVKAAGPTQIETSNTYWQLESNVLTISGTGAMPDFRDDPPWVQSERDIRDEECTYSLVIGSGITTIGDWSFNPCEGIKSVTFEEGSQLTTIKDYAFDHCGLTSINLPETLTSIGQRAFSTSPNITSISIPAAVTYIGDSAFWACESLTSITVNALTPPTLVGDYVFGNYEGAEYTIFVPANKVDTYKAAPGWSAYADKIVAIPHIHSFTSYEANDNVLSATCANTDGGCALTDCKVLLTLSASDADYSGSAVAAEFGTEEAGAWKTAVGSDAPAITYEAKEGSALTDGKAVNAGSYTAKVTAGDATATKDFTISPKEVTDLTITAKVGEENEPAYTGSAMTPAVVVKDGEKTLVKDTDYTLPTDISKTTVGDYTITVTGMGNYTGTKDVTWKIKGVDFGADDITVTAYSDTYDGDAHGISVALSGTAEGATVEYSTNESTWSQTKPTLTDVGTQTVYYRVSKENYNTASGSETITIDPLELAFTWGTTSFTYDGTVQTPAANITNKVGSDDVAISVTGGQQNAGTGLTATAASITGAKAGNYALPTTGLTTSYSIAAKDITVSITAADSTYGDVTAASAVLAGVETGDTVTPVLTYTGTDYNSTTVPTEAGTYTVTATLSGTSAANYNLVAGTDKPLSKTFAINPKELSENAALTTATKVFAAEEINIVANNNLTVTDGAKTLVAGTDYEISGTSAATNYGTYTFTVTYKGNYTGSEEVTWGITKKAITGVAAENVDVIYDGEAKEITVTGTENGDTIAYSLSENSITKEAVTMTDVTDGAVTVWYKVFRDTNHEEFIGSATITISPKEATLAWEDTTLTYNGEEQKPSASVTNLVAGDTCTVTVSGNQINAGEYTATAEALSNENYKLPETNTSIFTIEKKAVSVTPDNVEQHVGKEEEKLTYTATGLVEGEQLEGITLTREEGTKAGTYEITATDDESDTNYSVTITGPAEYTIIDHTEEVLKAKAATCTEKGLTEGKKCSVCDEILEEQKDVAAKGHTWDAGVVTKEPTTLKEGVKTYTCTVCKETKTEAVDKLPKPKEAAYKTKSQKSTVVVPEIAKKDGKKYAVTSLKKNAFPGKYVTKVVLPASIEKISSRAFSGDNKLRSIKINSKKITVSKTAFKGVSKANRAKIKVTVSKKMSKKNFKKLKANLVKQGLKAENIVRK